MILVTTSMNSYSEVVDAKFSDENLTRMQFEEISATVATVNIGQQLKQESQREDSLKGTLRTLKHSSEKRSFSYVIHSPAQIVYSLGRNLE